MNIFKKIKNTIVKYKMLGIHDRVLVGVSGGPDSVTLLRSLNDLKEECKLTLKAAHLDHMIRGEESHQDMKFVESLCKNSGIDFCYKKIDILFVAQNRKDSVEKVAREERYKFFKEIAQEENFKKIALGHNADDVVETILMHIIRGAGISGLTGISPVRNIQEDSDIFIIRPLIEISSKEIRNFLDNNNISYRIDSTNKEQIYFRNKIRHQLLPLLEEYNVNVKNLLLNMSYNISITEDYITKQGRRRYRSVSSRKDNKVIIDLKRFRRYHQAIKQEIFRNAIQNFKNNLKKITYQHWQEFELLVNERPTGSIVDLPYNMAVRKERERIVFYHKKV